MIGLRSFKAFLESIVYAEDRNSTTDKQRLLKEYLESQSPQQPNEDARLMLPSLVQAWTFASQTNNDGLVSAISAIFALLLKTISSFIGLRDLGLELCKTILQRDQLKVISTSLSAQRQKEHVISPSLRLLTEIVTFDGGTLARKAFAEKNKPFTFAGKILARNLSLWKAGAHNEHEEKARPAVRSNAVRYLLANLKHQSNEAKIDMLKYGNVIRSLFEHVQHDPIDVLKDIFSTLRLHVLDQQSLPRQSKSFVLHERNLLSIASLYKSDGPSRDGSVPASQLAHEFLKYVCTEPKAGILRKRSGWYPPGTETSQEELVRDEDHAEIDLGLDSVEWFNRFQSSVHVRNITLAGLAQNLRPHTSNFEAELVMQIFQAAPELVADYFFKKTSFAFDPKLSATWLGYASFLFSTILLPLPEMFDGDRQRGPVPPPTFIVLENILPQPLTQKIFTRCLNQQTGLITFFAIRILVVALEKLQRLLSIYDEAAASEGPMWSEGARRLLNAFTERCPRMREVVTVQKKTSTEDKLQYEAMLRLLSLYYQVTPQLAAEEKFDISSSLLDELTYFEGQSSQTAPDSAAKEGPNKDHHTRLIALNHMLAIATHSSDVRWFHRAEDRKLSPVMMLIKLISTMTMEAIPSAMWDLATSICEENGVLSAQSSVFAALIACLRSGNGAQRSESQPASSAVLEFLDDAIARTVRKPIKYEDDLDQISPEPSTHPVSLLHMALVEQWRYAFERGSKGKLGGSEFLSVHEFLARFIWASIDVGEDELVLNKVYDKLQDGIAPATEEAMKKAATSTDTHNSIQKLLSQTSPNQAHYSKQDPTLPPSSPPKIPHHILAPPTTRPNAPALHRWTTKDLPTAVADNDLTRLILTLSHPTPEIRHTALRSLRTFSARLTHLRTTNPTSFPDAAQFELLIGIVVNTAAPLLHPIHGSSPHVQEEEQDERENPIPAILPIYAAFASRILQSPLHPLYAAVNDFHLKGPRWDVGRLASYWTHTVLFTGVGEERSLGGRPRDKGRVVDVAEANADADGGEVDSEGTTVEDEVLDAEISTPLRFLLSLVFSGVRDTATLEILRRKGTLEPLLSLAANPGVRDEMVEMLLRILWRITYLEGGSDMSITRKGVVAWVAVRIRRAGVREINGVRGKGKREGDVERDDRGGVRLDSAWALKQLVKRIWETCDQSRVREWSRGGVEREVRRLIGEESSEGDKDKDERDGDKEDEEMVDSV